jgi:hypothetical protein
MTWKNYNENMADKIGQLLPPILNLLNVQNCPLMNKFYKNIKILIP